MKLGACLLTAAVVFPGAWAFGADTKADDVKPVVTFDVMHDVSPPLRLIRSAPPRPGPNRQIPMGKLERKNGIYPPALPEDPLLRGQAAPAAPMPPPLVSFEGTSDDDNAAVIGFRIVPPDTNGDVGPNHYVQFNNLIFEVFNKTGTSLLGPLAGNTPWAGFGGFCQTNNDGDPMAIYDQLADRWILSQFSIDEGIQCVAVSTTPDPTGAFFRYAFNVTPGGANDYPKMGVWPDAYYSSYRRFPGSTFRIVAAAFNRAQMLTGAAAQMITFDIVPPSGLGCVGSGDCYDGILPAHLEGLTPPPAGAPGLFVTAFDDEFNQGSGGGTPNPTQDFYKIWKFHVDFATPANSTLTGPVNVPTAEFDENLCGGAACVPQPAPGEVLDHLSFFTMYRPSYRNRGGVESLLVNNTVDLGGDRAGIRWAEIRDPAGTPSLFQTGTHGPADGVHRWMGSIAMDADGNIALGYSASSTSLFPSIRYVGRLAGDPLGSLPQTEVDLIAGAGAQLSNSFNRWGDYSAMSVDESDGCTFWYTTEYYANSAAFDFKTRIGSFKFPSCGTGATGVQGTVTEFGGGALAGVTVASSSGPSTTTDGTGNYLLALPAGTYDITFSKAGYWPQTVSGVVVPASGTVTVDAQLTLVGGGPDLSIGDVSVVEGNTPSTTDALFPVTLSAPSGSTITVDYTTQDGTATVADNDYTPISGTIAFNPGETTRNVTVSVIGDLTFEANETYFVSLSNAVAANILDGIGLGTIVNDDFPLAANSRTELVHGSNLLRTLATVGVVPFSDYFPIRSKAHQSWEVVVDGTTGDVATPTVGRLDSDGTTVLQVSTPIGSGISQSLRWENPGSADFDGFVRVDSGGCFDTCTAEDQYHIRAYDTTYSISRFNNSATQVTLLVIQNTSTDTVAGTAWLWNAAGTLVISQPFSLAPNAVFVVNTSTLAPGVGGSITVSHDGRYGSLAGKAVAVEPATGFTFDTLMVPRGR